MSTKMISAQNRRSALESIFKGRILRVLYIAIAAEFFSLSAAQAEVFEFDVINGAGASATVFGPFEPPPLPQIPGFIDIVPSDISFTTVGFRALPIPNDSQATIKINGWDVAYFCDAPGCVQGSPPLTSALVFDPSQAGPDNLGITLSGYSFGPYYGGYGGFSGTLIVDISLPDGFTVAGDPEPSTWALLILGFAGPLVPGHRRAQVKGPRA